MTIKEKGSRSIPPRSFKSGYVWLYLSKGLVVLAGFLLFKLASHQLGVQGFSEYALSRRTITLLSPALILGLGVALPRAVAMERSDDSTTGSNSDFWVSLILLFAIHALLFLPILMFPGLCARGLFGDSGLGRLMLPIGLYLAGLSWYGIIRALFRGQFRFGAASVLDVAAVAVIPTLAFLLFGSSLARVLGATGVMILGVCLGLTLWLARESGCGFGGFRSRSNALLSYSVPRIPGDFLLGGLLGFPSLIAAHFLGVSLAGFFAFGSTMLTLAGLAVSPISTVLLPQSASLHAEGRIHELRGELGKIIGLSLVLALVGLTVVELGMGLLLKWYLGEGFEEAVPILRVLAVCVVPYILFFSLRSVIDAANVRAINTRNILLAVLFFLAVTGIWSLVSPGQGAILGGNLCGHFLLGGLTLWEVKRIFSGSISADSQGFSKN
jgi:O-antigen/teichoic acid export membrane protein